MAMSGPHFSYRREYGDLSMTLVVVTDAEQLIPLDDIKQHCRITEDDLDTQLISLAEAAADWVEEYTGRPARAKVYDLILDAFLGCEIEFPRAPLISLTAASCTYVSDAGVVTQIPTATYTTDIESIPGRVYLAYNQSWPLTRYQPKAVRWRFTAGYESIDDLPEKMRQACLLHIQNALDHGGADEKLEKAAQALVWPLRIFQ